MAHLSKLGNPMINSQLLMVYTVDTSPFPMILGTLCEFTTFIWQTQSKTNIYDHLCDITDINRIITIYIYNYIHIYIYTYDPLFPSKSSRSSTLNFARKMSASPALGLPSRCPSTKPARNALPFPSTCAEADWSGMILWVSFHVWTSYRI